MSICLSIYFYWSSVRQLNVQKCSEPEVFFTWLQNVCRATTVCTFSTSQLPKVVRMWCAFTILTSTCASCPSAVRFFDISTSKSGPRPPEFNTFDFKMCFAPQRRALFRHLNFQKRSGSEALFANFDFEMCTLWTSHLTTVLQTRGAFNILTSTCASRHNGVHFFNIASSESALMLRCFQHFDLRMCFTPQRRAIFDLSSDQMAPHPPSSILLFDPPKPQNNIGKTQCFATFLLFRAPASSFFWLFLFSNLLSSSVLSLTALTSAAASVYKSEVWLLIFIRQWPNLDSETWKWVLSFDLDVFKFIPFKTPMFPLSNLDLKITRGKQTSLL